LEDIERVFTKHAAQAFQGQFGLKLEYDFDQKSLNHKFSVRFVYQISRTGNVNNRINEA
jgi:hypothetical protein